ncbi:MAG: outer membrane lipoprotein-sorting protein [Deltaproteobacteria bacterium]|nr:outer membrane lipoprotein-sorting protein [Deltaproteobacteria bacterium]
MEKKLLKTVFYIVALLMFVSLALADEPNGRDIMFMVYNRPDGEDRTSTLTMTLINKRGSQRVRQVDSWSKDYGPDRKSAMVFREPADVRGTAYLSWDYEEVDKDDDKWLYMPAMKKVRRISGSSRNEYFMGTDFTYDDMGKRAVAKDTHVLLGEENVRGHDCWKIESVPVDPEDLYTRRVLWISKTALLVLKAEYHDKDGLAKNYNALEFQEQDGFWTLLLSEMDNVSREHKTVMRIESMRYDSGLEDDLFQVSTIERGRIR